MNRLRALVLFGSVALAGAASVLACSDMSESAAYGDPRNNNPNADGGGSLGNEPGRVGQTSGVVLVHAAAFPAYRVCFQNLPQLAPQPDKTVMPQANVVGVEVGSVVRIDPIEAPGKVYVITEKAVRTAPGVENPLTCGKLICNDSTACLERNAQYFEAGEINEPLGQDRVHLLAITGCGGLNVLSNLGLGKDDCETGWDPAAGSLRARTIPLLPASAANEKELPVQLVHMSTPLEAKRKAQILDVTFGPLGDAGAESGAPQLVASGPTIFAPASQETLQVDQGLQSFFGTHGFRVALRGGVATPDGGADGGDAGQPTTTPGSTPVFTQSLADVQELSQPEATPSTYYRVASNYALLLLGDPRFSRLLEDGGANANYDPRRGLHILAIPVKEATDAGPGSVDSPPITDDGGGQ